MFKSGNCVSASLSSSLILTVSMPARGRVAKPVPAQKTAMFSATMPTSRVPNLSFISASPIRNLPRSVTRISRTGAGVDGAGLASGLAGGGIWGFASGFSPGLAIGLAPGPPRGGVTVSR